MYPSPYLHILSSSNFEQALASLPRFLCRRCDSHRCLTRSTSSFEYSSGGSQVGHQETRTRGFPSRTSYLRRCLYTQTTCSSTSCWPSSGSERISRGPELGGYSVPCVPREDFSATGEIFLFSVEVSSFEELLGER